METGWPKCPFPNGGELISLHHFISLDEKGSEKGGLYSAKGTCDEGHTTEISVQNFTRFLREITVSFGNRQRMGNKAGRGLVGSSSQTILSQISVKTTHCELTKNDHCREFNEKPKFIDNNEKGKIWLDFM
jgi:hypothetical protein